MPPRVLNAQRGNLKNTWRNEKMNASPEMNAVMAPYILHLKDYEYSMLE